MINKLIEKYKKRITKIENSDFPYWLFRTSSEEFFYNEGVEAVISTYKKIIKDLEKLKPEIDKKSLLSYLDYGCGSHFELGSQHEEFLENIKEYLGVDTDE